MEKVAFITGAGGYIGGDIAKRFAKNGMKVALCDINENAMEKVATEIASEGGIAYKYVADMRSSESVDTAINAAVSELGRLDVLIHAAGGSERSRAKLLVDLPDDVIEDVIGVNLMGAFWSNRAAARIMVAQGEGGKIINFASAVGINGLAKRTSYSASKGGVMSLVKSLAKELGPHQINVNAVAPGIVLRDDQNQGPALTTNVFGRKCVAKDITDLVEFLASDKAGYITGQTYVIDGARSLSMKGTD